MEGGDHEFLKKFALDQRFKYGEDEPLYVLFNSEPDCREKVLREDDLPY